MKHVEAGEKELLVANVDGKFYAIGDRCGHMNASLSMGALNRHIVTCAMHGAQYDVTTGRKIIDPKLVPPPGIEQLPPGFLKALEHSGRLMGAIKTYELERYEVLVEGDRIKIQVG